MKTADNMQDLIQYFPERLRESIAAFGNGLTEIRLRREKPIILMRNSDMLFVDSNGKITKAVDSECVKVTSVEIDSFSMRYAEIRYIPFRKIFAADLLHCREDIV